MLRIETFKKYSLGFIFLLNFCFAFLYMALNQASFDQTGSNKAFGDLITVQLLIQLGLSLLFGNLIDRLGARVILHRGLWLFFALSGLAGVCLAVNQPALKSYVNSLLMLIVALYGPLVFQALFVVFGTFYTQEELQQVYGKSTGVSQAGQIFGAFLSVPFLRAVNLAWLSFIVCGIFLICRLLLPKGQNIKKGDLQTLPQQSWSLTLSQLKRWPLLKSLLLSVMPLVIVTAFNLRLPVLDAELGLLRGIITIKSYSAVLDGLFCLGAAISGFILAKKNLLRAEISFAMTLLLLFLFYGNQFLSFGVIFFLIVALLFGFFISHFSMTQNISLQKLTEAGSKGKIVALQQALNMFFTIVLTHFII